MDSATQKNAHNIKEGVKQEIMRFDTTQMYSVCKNWPTKYQVTDSAPSDYC